MNSTAVSQIQRQSSHECIIECHQQNSTPSIQKEEYFEIGLSLLESVSGFESCDNSERFNIGGLRKLHSKKEPLEHTIVVSFGITEPSC